MNPDQKSRGDIPSPELKNRFPFSRSRNISDFIRVDTIIKKKAAVILALTLPKPLILFCDESYEAKDIAKEINFFMLDRTPDTAPELPQKQRVSGCVRFFTEDLTISEKDAVQKEVSSNANAILCAEYTTGLNIRKECVRTKIYLSSPERKSSRAMILIETDGETPCLELLCGRGRQEGYEKTMLSTVEISVARRVAEKNPRRFTKVELGKIIRDRLNDIFRPFFSVNIFDSHDTSSLIECLISQGLLRMRRFPFTSLIDLPSERQDFHPVL